MARLMAWLIAFTFGRWRWISSTRPWRRVATIGSLIALLHRDRRQEISAACPIFEGSVAGRAPAGKPSGSLVQALLAHIEVFFPPLGPEPGAVLAAELGERRFDGVAQALDGAAPVAMRPAQGLGHDLVDDAELEQV